MTRASVVVPAPLAPATWSRERRTIRILPERAQLPTLPAHRHDHSAHGYLRTLVGGSLATVLDMAVHVTALDLATRWEPNAPDAVLITADRGTTVLALAAHYDDVDQRCLVLIWTGTEYACMGEPNDETLPGHRLYGKGLREALWGGIVHESELIAGMERQNRVHPAHDSTKYAALTHHVLPLKEGTVEVVAGALTIERYHGSTLDAAVAALHR